MIVIKFYFNYSKCNLFEIIINLIKFLHICICLYDYIGYYLFSTKKIYRKIDDLLVSF